MTASTPCVLIVAPCLNEEAHLDALITGLRADPGASQARIVIADGGSSDKSTAIGRAHEHADPRVRVIDNVKRLQSAGVNLAARELGADADLIIRVDAHGAYPPDYCARLIAAQAQSRADSVVVAMRAAANTQGWFQHAAAAAQNSRLGTGGSPHRSKTDRVWVNHGHHALMRLEMFRRVGGYDEGFSHNEDAELDARIRAAGGRILLAGDIVMTYYPRTGARALLRQYFNYGKGRARMLRRHNERMRPRQALPLATAPALGLALLAPLWPWTAAPAAIWLAVCLVYGVALGVSLRDVRAMAAGVPAAIMHGAWSAGFLRETLAPVQRGR